MVLLFSSGLPYHIIFYSLTLGTNVFHSYVNAPVLFKNLKREDFSYVTNLILPKYFILEAIAPAALYLTLPKALLNVNKRASIALLGASSVFQLINYFWLLGSVQRLKTSKLKLEAQLNSVDDSSSAEAEEIKTQLKQLSKQFGMYHGLSLLANMISTVALTGYGFALSSSILKYIPK